MNISGIIHIIAALSTVIFAIFIIFQVIHRNSIKHRITKMSARMKPLMIGRTSRNHIIELMRLDGYEESEAEELYELLEKELKPKQSQVKSV